MYSAALRPGVALGERPERELPRDGVLDRALNRLVARRRHVAQPPLRDGKKIVRAIARQERRLLRLDAAAFDTAVSELRIELSRKRLGDARIKRAFAMVRVIAARELAMRHFDVQLLGGWAMFKGMIAEMQTGEGKTLTATLPACTAAMAGIPVHVITVNDYLVERDAEAMRPVYAALGLSVGAVTAGMTAEARKAAYGCDVTYCTGKQLVFDYLRDRQLVRSGADGMRLSLESLHDAQPRTERLLLRGLCFGIVDEADSILVDEARTPLVISRDGQPAFAATVYHEASALARELVAERDFTLDLAQRSCTLTDAGRSRLEAAGNHLDGPWRARRQRETLIEQALHATHLLERDRHYLVRAGKVEIIDEYTGRAMPDRSWERGLHQLVEAKEGCEISAQPETVARISYQRFFRRYLHLAGMTGTAREVAGELWSVYRLPVTVIAPHRRSRRRMRRDRVFATADARWSAVRRRVARLHAANVPVLIGTRSVAAAERLSTDLSAADIPHRVLNARQDTEEAEIIAGAGQPGQVTVATNMAGRGTDIVLGTGVAKLGGLHVIATERHDASRIDRQLAGRCARQGDPGRVESFASFEDDLVLSYAPRWRAALMRAVLPRRARLAWRWLPSQALARGLLDTAQARAEREHARARRALAELDERLGDALAFSGKSE